MSDGSRLVEADICIVGAGIVGLAHAHEARRRGLRVVLLERDRQPVGASVRNFGHLFFTGLRDGADHACGLRAREHWLALDERAGLNIRRHGTLIVARAQDELALLEHVAADPDRAARMLTAAEVARLVPIPSEPLVGALHCELDMRVDPRGAAAALAALLEQDDGAEVLWSTHVHAVEPGGVHAGGVTVRAPHTLVCPGPAYRTLPPDLRTGLESLTSCQLQMLRVAAPAGRRYGPALATGLSLVRYPAFASQPGAAALRARLEAERPELLEAGIHLLVTQLPDGDLVIGDTHTYGDTLAPFGRERLHELLLAEARTLLGADELTVIERWQGIYPSAAPGNFLITAPLEGVRVIEVISGLGMTLSFGKAPEVLDELLSGVPVATGPLASSPAATVDAVS